MLRSFAFLSLLAFTLLLAPHNHVLAQDTTGISLSPATIEDSADPGEQFIETLKQSDPDSPLRFVLIDDESYDVRNRLSIIGTNGAIGFCKK